MFLYSFFVMVHIGDRGSGGPYLVFVETLCMEWNYLWKIKKENQKLEIKF